MNILRSRISALMALCVATTACVMQLGCGSSDSGVPASAPETFQADGTAASPQPGAAIYSDAAASKSAMPVQEGTQHFLKQVRPADPSVRVGRHSVVRATFELMPGEELWVIAKGFDPATPADQETPPGCGALMAKLPDVEKEVPVPLKHTAVVGNIDGYIATVNVTQQFQNPYNSKIEAVYVFPLPDNAAVSEFVMTVGERKIRGIIREREEDRKSVV